MDTISRGNLLAFLEKNPEICDYICNISFGPKPSEDPPQLKSHGEIPPQDPSNYEPTHSSDNHIQPNSNVPLLPSEKNIVYNNSTPEAHNQHPSLQNYKEPPPPQHQTYPPLQHETTYPPRKHPTYPPLQHPLPLKFRPKHTIYNPLATTLTKNSVREISLMVTFVHDHNATMFWAQIISPETVLQSTELERLLALHCPCLQPVKSAQRHLVFATLWDGSWYRCITISAPDKSNVIEVFFVDYGNRCKRRVTELVQLPYLFASIPFLAYPFKMDGLVQECSKEVDAISSICVNEALTGVISTRLTNDEICSIVLMRPPYSVAEELPECRSYNTFLLAKGYVRKSSSEEAIPLLPTSFYIKSLSERLVKAERKNAKQKVAHPRNVSLSHDESQPLNHCVRTPNKNNKDDKENVEPNAGNSGKTNSRKEAEKKAEMTSSEITSNLFNKMFEEVKKYVASCKSSMCELTEVKVAFEQLQNANLPAELIRKKDVINSEESVLSVLQDRIRQCTDKKELDDHIVKRDEQVILLRQSIQNYLTTHESCDAASLLSTVKTLCTEFGSKERENTARYSTPEEAFQVLSKLETNYKEDKITARTNCNSTLNQSISYFTDLASLIKSATDDNSDVNNNIETLPQLSFDQVFDDLKHHDDVITAENKAISPVIGSLNTLILTQANNQYAKMHSFIGIKDTYLKRVEQLSNFSQDKPDVSRLTDIKTKVKKAKRNLKLAQLDLNSDSENESDTEREESLTKAMLDLHLLYKDETKYLSNLVILAQTQYPELLITYPQLNNLISGNSIIKRGWELNEFVLPDSKTYLNSEKQLVLQGLYCGEVCYVVNYSLRSGGNSLESEAVELIKLEECFAVFIDSKRLQAYGCSMRKPL